MSLVWELERSPTEVFSFQKPVKSVMQFYKESYLITKIITQVQEKVPNTNCSTKPGGPTSRRQQPDKVRSGCPRAGIQQQQFCWMPEAAEDYLSLLSTEARTFSAAGFLPGPLVLAVGSKLQGEAAVHQHAPHPVSPQQGTAAVPALTQQAPALTRLWAPMLTCYHHGTVHAEQKGGEFYQQHTPSPGLIPSCILSMWEENPAPWKCALTREDKRLLTVKNLSCHFMLKYSSKTTDNRQSYTIKSSLQEWLHLAVTQLSA